MKKLYISLLLASFAGVFSSAHAQMMPFFRSFLDNVTDGIKFIGPGEGGSGRTNAATLTTEGLQLTSENTQVGAFYLPNYIFTTEDGLVIEFEYMMYGAAAETDGMCIFLVDGQPNYTSDLRFGAEGSGFGYTFNWAIDYHSGHRKSGIKGAYLGIALDQGYFKRLRFQGEELRNGIPYKWMGTNPSIKIDGTIEEPGHDSRSNITIRGAAGRGPSPRQIVMRGQRGYDSGIITKTHTMQEGYWGYPVLYTRTTGDLRNQVGYVLNTSTVQYDKMTSPSIPTGFNIAGGAKFTSPTQAAYRKAIVTLDPNPNKQEGGFKISVSIQHGGQTTEIVKEFTYPALIRYPESGLDLWQSRTGVNPNYQYWPEPAKTPTTVEYTVPAPTTLVIGFAASTGLNNYTNVIKNLRITPVGAPTTTNDDMIDHRRGAVTIKPLENDIGYPSKGSSEEPSSKFLDPQTFRFWFKEEEGGLVNSFEYTDVNKGKWVYDPSTAEVMFFPKKGFTGTAWMLYDIKGSETPYNDEKFRSSKAVISVTIDDNQPT